MKAETIKFGAVTGQFYELSKAYPCEIVVDGIKYSSVEQFIQATKFDDNDTINIGGQTIMYSEYVRNADTLKEVIIRGNGRTPSVNNWEQERVHLLGQVMRAKFEQYPYLMKKLLDTGDARLVYATPTDSTLGSGRDGNGTNWLGIILERIRRENAQVKAS